MAKSITEDKAKKQLGKMLEVFTIGSILHLLADVHAEQVAKSTSKKSHQLQLVQHALIVVGAGIDSVLPS